MGLFDEDSLDEVIDGALRGESMRDVPFGFHRRVDGRLRIIALLDAERRRFRRGVTFAVSLFVAATVLGIGGLLYADIVSSTLRSVPGALGRVDYAAYLWGRWWQEAIVTCVLAFSAMAIALYVAEGRTASGGLQAS